MMKFLQWSLVAIVVIVLLAAVVGQILASRTGRAREASVVALKEKLAQPDVERTVATPTVAIIPDSAADTIGAPDLVSLRERWLAFRSESAAVVNECTLAPTVLAEIRKTAANPENWTLDREEVERVSAYQACLGEFMAKAITLCEDSARFVELTSQALPQEDVIQSSVGMAFQMLETYAQVQTAAREHSSAMAALSGLFDLTIVDTDYKIYGNDYVAWIWAAVGDALASGAVSEERWDRLLRQLAGQRDPMRFVAEVRRESAEVLYEYENFSETLSNIPISKHPIGYAQNWAYKNVTTPLFNHDVEVFGRATSILLDLTGLPYFEAKPALDQFYEDFDVEPSPNEIKFVRGNSAWMHVLELSRVGFKSEARRQASVDIARIAIVLDRHQRNTSTYPETLSALTEGLDTPALVNPLDGRPYFYERSEESFWLGYVDPTLDELEESAGARSDDIVYWRVPYGGFGVYFADGTQLDPFVRDGNDVPVDSAPVDAEVPQRLSD